ncbi:hypothetical protein [Variovorax boronicumulans]
MIELPFFLKRIPIIQEERLPSFCRREAMDVRHVHSPKVPEEVEESFLQLSLDGAEFHELMAGSFEMFG